MLGLAAESGDASRVYNVTLEFSGPVTRPDSGLVLELESACYGSGALQALPSTWALFSAVTGNVTGVNGTAQSSLG